jgi:lysine-specific demethylase/histidyl-hydroxylase NO66
LDGFLSKDSICDLLETHPVYNGRDLNVTRYEEGKDVIKRHITLDPQADNDEEFVLADSKDVLENFDSGCTLCLLCPHKHNDALRTLLSMQEWEWGCMVGANVYLTQAAASQGFAPHYDDIEAFVLQLEGYKHWKGYAPLSKMEMLPRESSSMVVCPAPYWFATRGDAQVQPASTRLLTEDQAKALPEITFVPPPRCAQDDDDDNQDSVH